MKEFRKIQQVNQTKKSTNETTTYCGHIFEAKPHDICYVSPALTPLQTVRYTKRTCTLTKLHILVSHNFKSSIFVL